MIVHSREELCRLYVIIKMVEIDMFYALIRFDDLLSSTGTCSSAEYETRPGFKVMESCKSCLREESW